MPRAVNAASRQEVAGDHDVALQAAHHVGDRVLAASGASSTIAFNCHSDEFFSAAGRGRTRALFLDLFDPAGEPHPVASGSLSCASGLRSQACRTHRNQSSS